MTDSPLSCVNLSVRFGEFSAVSDANTVTALIGPNGAGKTTILNSLSGQQLPTAGRISLLGRDVTRTSAHQRAKLGLGRSFQIMSVFSEDSVEDNLRTAGQRIHMAFPSLWRSPVDIGPLNSQVDEMLELIGLSSRRRDKAGLLSHGEQRALEIGLSVMSKPTVLLLDEPLAGIGHSELNAFMDLLRRVCSTRTVVLVEHNMDAVMKLSQSIVVLTGGRVLARGSPVEIQTNPKVREAYLG
jgi:branched-chain amino acid transport system ATP-binding protein